MLDGGAAVSDAELDALNSGNGNYSGASLTIARNGGANADDAFAVVAGSGFTVSGNALQTGGLTFATFTSAGGTLTIDFTSSATPATTALVNDVLDHVTYANQNSVPPANVTLDYSFSDGNTVGAQGTGGAKTSLSSLTVDITAVNDAPVLTGVGPTHATSTERVAATLDGGAAVSDAELDALNSGNGDYSGASLTIARNGGANAGRAFAVVAGSGFTVSGNALQAGGQTLRDLHERGRHADHRLYQLGHVGDHRIGERRAGPRHLCEPEQRSAGERHARLQLQRWQYRRRAGDRRRQDGCQQPHRRHHPGQRPARSQPCRRYLGYVKSGGDRDRSSRGGDRSGFRQFQWQLLTVALTANGLPEDQLSILTDATVVLSGSTVSVGGNEVGHIVPGADGTNGSALKSTSTVRTPRLAQSRP